jgi:DNA-binding Lrp family transcriptional regulator
LRAEHLPTRARTVDSGREPARRVACARCAHREIKKSLRKIAVSSLDAEKLNLGVSVFIAVKTNQHNAEWVQRFRKIVVSFPEVVGFYRLRGDVDYLIRAVVSDIRAYDDLYHRLIAKFIFMTCRRCSPWTDQIDNRVAAGQCFDQTRPA